MPAMEGADVLRRGRGLEVRVGSGLRRALRLRTMDFLACHSSILKLLLIALRSVRELLRVMSVWLAR